MNAKHAATKITGTVAKPSSPSVRLTAFEEPTITKAAKGIKTVSYTHLRAHET